MRSRINSIVLGLIALVFSSPSVLADIGPLSWDSEATEHLLPATHVPQPHPGVLDVLGAVQDDGLRRFELTPYRSGFEQGDGVALRPSIGASVPNGPTDIGHEPGVLDIAEAVRADSLRRLERASNRSVFEQGDGVALRPSIGVRVPNGPADFGRERIADAPRSSRLAPVPSPSSAMLALIGLLLLRPANRGV